VSPADAPPWAARLLHAAGREVEPPVRALGGGHGQLLRVGSWVVKGPVSGAPGAMFLREGAGLKALAAAGARVPRVHHVEAAGLVMDYLPPAPPGPTGAEALGRMVAALHGRRPAPGSDDPSRYGWPDTVFLGSFEFPEGTGSWPHVFRELRMTPLLRATWSQLGALGPRIEAWLEAVELPEEGACLVHGDLWSGNVVHTADGPALIDPGAQWAERGLDLSMMELFGGFGGRCRAAYEEALPVPEAVRAVIPGYQLVYLLVHVHFFGSGYLSGVAGALDALGA